MSTDSLAGAEQSVARFGVHFPILYTAKDSTIPKSYGVFNLHSDGLASASVWVITEGNEIAWRSIGESYTHQVHPNDIIEQVNLLGRSVRAGG